MVLWQEKNPVREDLVRTPEEREISNRLLLEPARKDLWIDPQLPWYIISVVVFVTFDCMNDLYLRTILVFSPGKSHCVQFKEAMSYNLLKNHNRSVLNAILILMIIGTINLFTFRSVFATTFSDRNAVQWEYEEWSLENDSWSGNPFDLVAEVTFKHSSSETTRTTEMFYDGNNTWKFRFTGTRTGIWSFTTSSSDSDLDGHTGTVKVSSNSDSDAYGFIVSNGDQFARMDDGPNDLEGFLPKTYMNEVDFGTQGGCGWTDIEPTITDLNKLTAYLDEVESMGMNGVFFHVIHQWLKAHAMSYEDHASKEPSLQTFNALENLIVKAHQRGLYVHFWAWGDEARKWTPIGLEGGINGKVDRRIQRYIAARLGPLPGWVMGYGFDLEEWVSSDQVGKWANFLNNHSGWDHMLWARGRDHPNLSARSISDSFVRSYSEIVSDMNETSGKPELYEERHTYLRPDDGLDMKTTRRFLWKQSIANGMMGFWGNYPTTCSAYGGDHPYPNPELLRTHQKFWMEKDRFRLDYQRNNGITDGWGLKDDSGERYVVYKEGTSSIQVDLSGAPGEMNVIAVNTASSYNEQKFETVSAANHTFNLPSTSDWALWITTAPTRN